MTRLDSRLCRALIFLSVLDQSVQHLVDVYVISDTVYFRIAVGHMTSIQRTALVELADLLQRPADAIKSHIRQVNKPEKDPDLKARMAMATAQKKQAAKLKKLLE